MKNKFISKLQHRLWLNVKGKNINRFIKRVSDKKIELLLINNINKNEANILIKEEDFYKLKEIKSIYDITIIEVAGMLKIKNMFNKNKLLLIFFSIGIIILTVLSNIIFEVEIIHTKKELREFLKQTLEEEKIKPFQFKRKYTDIEKIKQKIIFENKDKIEWLEIEPRGTKYIIRVEERQLPKPKQQFPNQHIVAKKSAIIKKIDALSGEIVKNVNDYVRPGDVIISGQIKLYDNIKNTTVAQGKVYGEVWYETKVTYPLVKVTHQLLPYKKNVLVLKFLNKKIELFNFDPFKSKNSNEKVILKSKMLPLALLIDRQQKTEKTETINTIDSAINQAINVGREKILNKLNEEEYIISQKSLKIDVKSSKIIIDVFFVVYEDITNYQEIIEEEAKVLE